MALVSISKAAQLAGTTRSNLYDSYINKGKLSLTKDHLGKPKIDTSELLRVFGNLKDSSSTTASDSIGQQSIDSTVQQGTDTKVYQELVQVLKNQIEDMKERLEEQKEREEFYQKQIIDLQQNVKLLTDQSEKKQETKKKKWWRW